MPVPKMAPISIVSEGEELERIEPQSFMKALVVEDYEAEREEIVQDLKDLGYSVDAFAYPIEAAAKIAHEDYQLSIVDVVFENGPHISGDEFIRKNLDILGKGKIVAYTAWPGNISDE